MVAGPVDDGKVRRPVTRIVERVGRAGVWSLDLVDGVPRSVTAELREAAGLSPAGEVVPSDGHVVVTTGWLPPEVVAATPSLWAWRGRLLEQTGVRSWAGTGLASWLGRANAPGPGVYVPAGTTDTLTLAEWVGVLAVNGLSAGTVSPDVGPGVDVADGDES